MKLVVKHENQSIKILWTIKTEEENRNAFLSTKLLNDSTIMTQDIMFLS